MFGVPGHNAVGADTHSALDKDGIFIIAVFIAECVLAVDAERIDQTEDSQQFPDYLPGFHINVFFFTTTSQTVTVIMTAAGVVLGAVLWMYQKKRNDGVAAA